MQMLGFDCDGLETKRKKKKIYVNKCMGIKLHLPTEPVRILVRKIERGNESLFELLPLE